MCIRDRYTVKQTNEALKTAYPNNEALNKGVKIKQDYTASDFNGTEGLNVLLLANDNKPITIELYEGNVAEKLNTIAPDQSDQPTPVTTVTITNNTVYVEKPTIGADLAETEQKVVTGAEVTLSITASVTDGGTLSYPVSYTHLRPSSL